MESQSPNPLGPLVANPNPTSPPTHVTLSGKHVTLVPLSFSHALDLYSEIGGPANLHLWDYMFVGPFPSLLSFTTWLTGPVASAHPEPLFFAILRHDLHNKAVGIVSLMRADLNSRVVEVGNIVLSPTNLAKTAAATEVYYLLGKYVFEELGMRRWEWKCNELNGPSKKAALRLGFAFEGVFRQHLIVKGRNRDTWWGSIVDREWKGCKAGFEKWLAEDNFNDGQQILGLKEIRERES